MAEKHSIYDCPYCGKKSFNPLTKALAGNMNTKGRVCKACGYYDGQQVIQTEESK